MPRRILPCLVPLFILLWLTAAGRAGGAAPLEFRLQFDKAAHPQPFTGRVFVLLTKQETKDLPAGLNWFKPEPPSARDVKDWKPGEPLVIGADAIWLSVTSSADLPKATYSIHAVMDLDRGDRNFSTAEGNVYSASAAPRARPANQRTRRTGARQDLSRERAFAENDAGQAGGHRKQAPDRVPQAAGAAARGWCCPRATPSEPDERRYPVRVRDPRVRRHHFGAFAADARRDRRRRRRDALRRARSVVPAGASRLRRLGEQRAVRSGPDRGADPAHREDSIRGIGTPAARFLTGHSSGGWSSLWLQVDYPEFFGGVWSTAPDSGRFSRLPADQRISRRREHVHRCARARQRPLARATAR